MGHPNPHSNRPHPDGFDPDEQYRHPTQAPGSTGANWMAIGPVGSLLFGEGGYVDEADPSWEEVVTMVVIPGNPDAIRDAAGNWDVLFRRIEQVKGLLDDGIVDLHSWQGEAAEAYRTHLADVSRSLGDMVEQHRPIIQQMNTSADNLQQAIDSIPIPDEMVHEVMAARQGFIDTGQISNGLFRPGAFYDALLPIYGNKWMDEIGDLFRWDWASDKLRDWLSSEDDKAKEAYQTLTGQHITTMDSMPQGQQMGIIGPHQYTVNPGTTAAPGAGSTGPGTSGFDPDDPSNPHSSGLAGVGSAPGAGAFGPGGPGATSGLGGLTGGPGGPGVPGTTGLGSAGGMGSVPGTGTGTGMGMGGMGAMGAGAAGAGAGGRGGGSGRASGIGSSAGLSGRPGSGMGAGGVPAGGLGAAGAGAGAGVGRGGGGAGAGAGRGGMGMGMGPMAGGGHGAGGGDEHTTWLDEDEDVWGAEGDAAPPVLGG